MITRVERLGRVGSGNSDGMFGGVDGKSGSMEGGEIGGSDFGEVDFDEESEEVEDEGRDPGWAEGGDGW